jgi:hypothetical protein
MAGLGWRTFTAGAVLTAAQVQGYLQDQAVLRFASATARTSALASPNQGMISHLTDSNSMWQYYEVYSAGNPGGASVAGWYPLERSVLFNGKRNNTGASIPDSAYTVLSFNTFSCAGGTSNTTTIQINSATAPSTFTVRQAGWYQVTGSMRNPAWSSTAGSARAIAANRNSTTYSTNCFLQNSNTDPSGIASLCNDSAVILLAAGDVIRFFVYQSSGAPATNSDTNFTIQYLRPASV